MRARYALAGGVDPEDPRQEQAGYPAPPASPAGANAEDDMLLRQRLMFNRTPDLDQPVPRAGMADFDREQDMRNAVAMGNMQRGRSAGPLDIPSIMKRVKQRRKK